MADEVETTVVYDVIPKDVAKEVGNIKLFNKWDYEVEVRDISLTCVPKHPQTFPTEGSETATGRPMDLMRSFATSG